MVRHASLLDMACLAAGRRGREVRRVDGNPHYQPHRGPSAVLRPAVDATLVSQTAPPSAFAPYTMADEAPRRDFSLRARPRSRRAMSDGGGVAGRGPQRGRSDGQHRRDRRLPVRVLAVRGPPDTPAPAGRPHVRGTLVPAG